MTDSSKPSNDTARNDGGVLFPQLYVWFVFLATLDVMFTALVLESGGLEVNWIADQVLSRWGIAGLTALKFISLVIVVCICEWVGQRKYKLAKRVGQIAVALNIIPVVAALIQLLHDAHVGY